MTGYAATFSNQATIVVTSQYQSMIVRPQPTSLCYSDYIIKRRVQREMICLQTDQSKVKGFFNVIVRLTWLSNITFLAGLAKAKIVN